MKQLELKSYTREEVSLITMTDSKDKNFARRVKDTLTKWGYSFEYSRKGVKITAIPTSSREVLSEMMIRYYGIDIQVDSYKFAVFTYCLVTDMDGFSSMPWEVRVEYLKSEFDITVASSTLKNWCRSLIKTNTITKDDSNKTYWMTMKIDGETVREEVEKDDEARINYWKDFWNLKNNNVEDIHSQLWGKYGCCFYSCKSFVFNAWDDVDLMQELIELVTAVAAEEAGEEIVVVNQEIKVERKGEFEF